MKRRLEVAGRLRDDETYRGKVEFQSSLEDSKKIEMMERLFHGE